MTDERVVAGLYDGRTFAYEAERLERHSPAEYGVTCRALQRWIGDGSVVADVGVGVGHYAALLAGRGCRLHLVDISSRLLAAARERLPVDSVLSAQQASATSLRHLDDGSCDAVLMLGPLYHLCEPEERQQAVREAWRLLRPQGILAAAGINRLAYLRDALRDSAAKGVARRAFHAAFLQEGNLDPQHAPPIGYAHLTTVAAFRALFVDAFEEVALLGVESFATTSQTALCDVGEADREAWLDLIEATAATPEGQGAADHFLFVGRRTSTTPK